MSSIEDYIESGILEMYVAGTLSQAERAQVEELAASSPLVREELASIEEALRDYAFAGAIEPDETVKPMLMATLDYQERLAAGEQVSQPPILNEHSNIEDFRPWLERADMQPPSDAGNLHAKIISISPEAVSLIVWIKEYAPAEVHNEQSERFLILEGSCYITVEDTPYALTPGDYFAIPLHSNHTLTVTSQHPCKALLQRVAV